MPSLEKRVFSYIDGDLAELMKRKASNRLGELVSHGSSLDFFQGFFDDIGRLGRCLEELFPCVFFDAILRKGMLKMPYFLKIATPAIQYILTTIATVCFMHLMHGLVLTIGGHKLPGSDDKEPSTKVPGASALGIIQCFQATVSVLNEFML